jgi:hypothetical protein
MASNATTLPGKAGDYPDWLELYNRPIRTSTSPAAAFRTM